MPAGGARCDIIARSVCERGASVSEAGAAEVPFELPGADAGRAGRAGTVEGRAAR